MLKIMDEISKYKTSLIYARPVNPELDGCLDYYSVIKDPMDLSTVRSKIEKNSYHSISEWKSDMQLIWANSKTYNNSQSLYGVTAQFLADKFNKMTKQFTDDENADWTRKLFQLQRKVKDFLISAPSSLPPPYFSLAALEEHRPKIFQINTPQMQNRKKLDESRLNKTSPSRNTKQINEIRNQSYASSQYNNVFENSARSANKKRTNDHLLDDNANGELNEDEMNDIAEEVNNLEDDEQIQKIYELLKEKEPQLIQSEDVDIEIQKFRPDTLRALQRLLKQFKVKN